LEKVLGNTNINKLWIVLLFEADFNNNKWIGQVVLVLVESLGLLAPSIPLKTS